MLPELASKVFFQALNQPALSSILTSVNTCYLAIKYFSGVAYFVLVFLFTFFYTGITFDPDHMAENLQKSGAFTPGVRPGESTQNISDTFVN